MDKFRFHLLSLPHIPQSREYSACAFTQKNRKLAKMLTSLGHTVFFYGSEGSDVEEYCNSDNLIFVQTHTIDDIKKSFGLGNNLFELGYDWRVEGFLTDFSKTEFTPATHKFFQSCISEINKVKKDDDFLLITQGNYQKQIVDEVKLFLNCESGIGYTGSNPNWFRAFESAYQQNFKYGSENPHQEIDGFFYDRVIPNYFDDDDIMFSVDKQNYCVFIGRMIPRKGIIMAYLASKFSNTKLYLAGQGAGISTEGTLIVTNGTLQIPAGNWEYLGFIDFERRKELLAHAKALLCPTEYLEPFGGVHVEAMLSGTPVITSNFGVFSGDTFTDGVHGYKCSTLDDYVWALNSCSKLSPMEIRNNAKKFLMQNVRWEYQRWFEDLYEIYLSHVDKSRNGRQYIRKEIPEWRKEIYK